MAPLLTVNRLAFGFLEVDVSSCQAAQGGVWFKKKEDLQINA